MENTSAAIECLILFYINMKHVLKTKQLIEKDFLDQMIKHCKESGFKSYNDQEIKNMWKGLILKYLELKNKGTVEDKENWKYFEILDSCYERSDFHSGVYPKFSEEMVWFLIECFLKRKTLWKTQKHNSVMADIHKEFLRCGYLYITKQDIENKWKYLNMRYDKLKDDAEKLKKLPYLQALQGFREESPQHIVNMIFTRELTEILIERFTEKKITCVIHGYNSDQVLNEIQSEFKDLGFYFTKEDIKEKWRKLSNIYKFLLAKGKNDTSWVYFNSMRNHFKESFSFPWGKTENKEYHSRSKRLRPRSKSVGAELSNKDSKKSLVGLVDRDEERICSSETKTVKRSSERSRRKNSPKKLKSNDNLKQKDVNPQLTDDCKDVNRTSKENSIMVLSDDKLLKKDTYLRKLSIERRDSTDIGSSPSKVHIINIDHSDIDRKNGNLTINLPSITKKFSDNEFLPLKKRLRVDGENSDNFSDDKKETKNDFSLFSTTDYADSQKGLTNVRQGERLTEEEMTEIVERMKENSHSDETDKKPNTSYFGSVEFNGNQKTYGDFNQQCLLIPKEECQDSLTMQDYPSPSTMAQPPVLLLVIKVDSKNTLKESGSNSNTKIDGGNSSQRSSTYDKNQETERKSNNLPDKQVNEQSSTIPHICADSKPASRKSRATRRKRKDSPCSKTNISETNITSTEKGAIVSDAVNNSDTQVCDFASDFNLKANEQLAVETLSANNSDCSTDIPIENSDVCTVAENVTVYTTEVISSEQGKDKSSEEQKVEEVVFREPLPVPARTENSVKLKGASTISDVANSGKVRLPVKCGGKLKEIYISRRELSKLKPKSNIVNKLNERVVVSKTTDTNVSVTKTLPEFNFVSQTVKPAATENLTDKIGSKFVGVTNLSHAKSGKNEEFENESVLSEAIGDDDGLKDNLLATVIDFQEQNNQEFIEIKNLMKQNNLLQRETNRLLRIMLEKK